MSPSPRIESPGLRTVRGAGAVGYDGGLAPELEREQDEVLP
ncbi:hypothetical protein MFUL124B02_21650 [Myxococcus fulvus 124B02]|nr:hypothetical protein MFUL124B02_21650 [Myxococcus fulvus 124B02]